MTLWLLGRRGRFGMAAFVKDAPTAQEALSIELRQSDVDRSGEWAALPVKLATKEDEAEVLSGKRHGWVWQLSGTAYYTRKQSWPTGERVVVLELSRIGKGDWKGKDPWTYNGPSIQLS